MKYKQCPECLSNDLLQVMEGIYQCQDCGHASPYDELSNDEDDVNEMECPECGCTTIEHLDEDHDMPDMPFTYRCSECDFTAQANTFLL